MKMFGNDLTFMTCNELLGKLRELSLSVAGFTVKLLKVKKKTYSRLHPFILTTHFKECLLHLRVRRLR